MEKWGEINKYNISYILDNTIAKLKKEVRLKEKDIKMLWMEYDIIKELINTKGLKLLDTTTFTRFANRMNYVRKKLEKGWD